MKGKRKYLLLCLMLCLILSFQACAPAEIEIRKASEFYRRYDAITDCEHEIGYADGDGWMAENGTVQIEGKLVEIPDLTLNAGAYKLRVEMTIDYNATHIDTVVGEIQVRDAETGETLSSFPVMRKDIPTVHVYTDIINVFPLYEQKTVDLVFLWEVNTMVKIRTVEMWSVTPAAILDPDKDAQRLMGTTETEIVENFKENALYYFDMNAYYRDVMSTSEYFYDMSNLLFTLQGLVNREKVRIWMNYSTNESDPYWLEQFTKEGGWLADREVITVQEPITLLTLFQDVFTGFVAWDNEVPATSNVAATICGVENRLPVRYRNQKGSIFHYLQQQFPDKDVKSLEGMFTGKGKIPDIGIESSGSAKNDAYLWAMEKYLNPGLTNKTLLAYHVDAYTDRENNGQMYYYDNTGGAFDNRQLSNKDYYIANKAFFFDLDTAGTVVASDDPGAPAGIDRVTLEKILRKQNELAGTEIITIGGFWPWSLDKYRENDSVHEHEMVLLFSAYNCILDPEAPGFTNLANGSVYMHYQGKESYVNLAKNKKQAELAENPPVLEKKNYLMLFMGDYDSSAWTNQLIVDNYLKDATRGNIPLVWPICPNNEAKVAHVYDAMYATQTEIDYFCYINSGLGQFTMDAMIDSDRPEGLNGTPEYYIEKTREAGLKYDLDLLGFMGAYSIPALEYFATLDVKGIANTWRPSEVRDINGVPIIHINNLAGYSLEEQASWLMNLAVRMKSKDGSYRPGVEANFIMVRAVVSSAASINSLYNYVRTEYPDYEFEAVDPYTFFELYAQRYGV